ncbi:MAG: cytochrome c [Candidatus Rokubacteria bacterium]|nr:cytochrome c [Candidatus Rokubacteria bacterium]
MMARRCSVKVVAAAVAVLATLALGGLVSAQGKWEAPPDVKKLKNPLPKSDKVLAQAKKIFETNCVACHGPKGLGDGPAAAALPVKPANWTSPATQSEADGELFWKITNGRGPMPPWKHLSENDRWTMVHFIRTLKK